MTPKARVQGLLVHRVGDEAVLYDRDRKIAHRLNATAARVWSSLDGSRSARDLASLLGLDQSVVELTLDHLTQANLLEDAAPLPVSRRAALRNMAAAATVGALVSSIPAPLAASATSSGHDGGYGPEADPGPDGGRGRGSGHGRGGGPPSGRGQGDFS